MKNTLTLTLLLFTACKSSSADDGVPCDPNATKLHEQMAIADGLNGEDAGKMADAKKTIVGKRFAFKSCHFDGHGGGEVMFTATGGEKEFPTTCVLSGGEAALDKFRKVARELDQAKLRIDISGTVEEHDNGAFKRLALTDCKVSAHE